MTAKIIPLPQAIIAHEMARQILTMSCEKAQLRGVLTSTLAQQIVEASKSLDTFHIRVLCDEVLTRLEAHRHAETA